MAELKTKQTNQNVHEFIDSFVENQQKREDSVELLKIFNEITGFEPKMWGNSIIGFGSYHYKSDRSTQEGDWPLVGFSPRKAAISLYIYSGLDEHKFLLNELGKFKTGKACIYIKKLSEINTDVLKNLIKATVEFFQTKHGQS